MWYSTRSPQQLVSIEKGTRFNNMLCVNMLIDCTVIKKFFDQRGRASSTRAYPLTPLIFGPTEFIYERACEYKHILQEQSHTRPVISCTYKKKFNSITHLFSWLLHTVMCYKDTNLPATTKLANKIQQAAITAANPITNPMNNQLLAPFAPKQPPL